MQARIQLDKEPAQYKPGEILVCEYEIDLGANDQSLETTVVAIETSILWMTEGKGDTDIGVHFFERREKKMVQSELLRQTHKLSAVLPTSPLSYEGEIVKIKWLVRVRMFLADGSETTNDQPFRLGNVAQLETSSQESEEEEQRE